MRQALEQEVAKSEATTDVAENSAKVTLETLEKHRNMGVAIKDGNPLLKFFENERQREDLILFGGLAFFVLAFIFAFYKKYLS